MREGYSIKVIAQLEQGTIRHWDHIIGPQLSKATNSSRYIGTQDMISLHCLHCEHNTPVSQSFFFSDSQLNDGCMNKITILAKSSNQVEYSPRFIPLLPLLLHSSFYYLPIYISVISGTPVQKIHTYRTIIPPRSVVCPRAAD
jgi:hypothetical protein